MCGTLVGEVVGSMSEVTEYYRRVKPKSSENEPLIRHHAPREARQIEPPNFATLFSNLLSSRTDSPSVVASYLTNQYILRYKPLRR